MVKEAGPSSDLESIVGADCVLPPERAADFAVDGLLPGAAVAPGSVDQVAEVMRYAHGSGLAVIPWGGGTLMPIGNTPRRYDIALSLSRLDQVIEHEPADLTLTCQAGITLDALQRRLAGAGQFLPLDPPHARRATIAGVLAANASGPRRHAYGSARDLTLGLRVVTADGRLTRAGGRVVKNVAGYDLCKLYIGSLGTLGVIVEATFKVAPLPKAQRTLALGFDAPAAACALAAEVQHRGLAVHALDLLNVAATARLHLPTSGRHTLLIELAGTTPGVERSLADIAALAAAASAPPAQLPKAGDAWEAVRRLTAPAEAGLLCRASVLPSRLPDLIATAEALGGPAVLARPTLGLAYAAWDPDLEASGAVAELSAAVARLGGTLVVQACPPSSSAASTSSAARPRPWT